MAHMRPYMLGAIFDVRGWGVPTLNPIGGISIFSKFPELLVEKCNLSWLVGSEIAACLQNGFQYLFEGLTCLKRKSQVLKGQQIEKILFGRSGGLSK